MPTVLAKFPEGYRHLAYLQSRNGFAVKGNLPGLRGTVVRDAVRGRPGVAGGSPTARDPL